MRSVIVFTGKFCVDFSSLSTEHFQRHGRGHSVTNWSFVEAKCIPPVTESSACVGSIIVNVAVTLKETLPQQGSAQLSLCVLHSVGQATGPEVQLLAASVGRKAISQSCSMLVFQVSVIWGKDMYICIYTFLLSSSSRTSSNCL